MANKNFSVKNGVNVGQAGPNAGFMDITANSIVGGYLWANHFNDGTDKNAIAGYSPLIQLRTDTGALVFYTSSLNSAGSTLSVTERMRIDAAGNVGISAIPSEWRPVTKAIQVNRSAFADVVSGFGTALGNNWYENNAADDAYIGNGVASLYYQNSGAHQWYSAPSGTAGAEITWVPSMTLNANGNLGIGTDAPAAAGSHRVAEIKSSSATSGGMLIVSTADGSGVGRMYSTSTQLLLDDSGSSSDIYIKTNGPNSVLLGTNNIERMRIDSSGVVTQTSNNAEFRLTESGTYYGSIKVDSSGGLTIGSDPSNVAANSRLIFGVDGSERMRIDASGNVGINTNAPTQRFEVVDTVDVAGQIRTTGTANSAFLSLVSGNGTTSGRYSYVWFFNSDTVGQQWRMGTYGDNNFTIRDHSVGASRIVIDTSGNVGVGQNPTTFNKFSTTSSVGITANGTKGTMGEVFANGVIAGFRANSYYDSGATTVKATSAGYSPEIQLRIDNGAIVFNRSTSVAIDAAIAQSESMRIDSSGNVLAGTTSALKTLTVKGSGIAVQGATQNIGNSLRLYRADSVEMGYIGWSDESVANSAMLIKSSNGNPITFGINTSEYMRIDNAGNVLIGVSTPTYNAAGRGLIELNGSTDTVIGLRVSGVAKGYLQATAANDILLANQSATGSLGLYTNSVARLVIDSSGNVGVGITAPTAKLDVNGISRSLNAREIKIAMGSADIDLSAGGFFTKTISGATTFTVSNAAPSGTSTSFILDLTNGGSAAITWWAGVKWAGGTAPTLTSSGRDVLGFFTHNGGTTWTGLLLGKDVK